ncbi:NAD(P)H-binding protein [Aureimonas altamirensis]|uniref:NAD(P)H-binding protein n=1 Tax=Aureimonas altamirensis TaxID=370622 RepID=UPI0030189861
MRILLIGATGGVGRRLLPMLVSNGHEVVGLHRKSEQAGEIEAAGGTPYLGDIIDMSVEDLAQVAQGVDVIVFSAGAAGSGLDRTTAIDGDGPIKAIGAAEKTGTKRIYLVSAFPDSERRKERNDRFEHYMAEKKRADIAVASSALGWVILRPGSLVHEDGEGQVALGRAVGYGQVARGNVAKVLAALIERPEIRREILELTDGDVPIAEAIDALAR